MGKRDKDRDDDGHLEVLAILQVEMMELLLDTVQELRQAGLLGLLEEYLLNVEVQGGELLVLCLEEGGLHWHETHCLLDLY